MEQTTLRKSRCEFRGIPFKFAAMSLGIIDAGMVAKAAPPGETLLAMNMFTRKF